MKTIIYLLQVSACTGIFYGFYFLLLRRLTFFTLNRWYLLATLLVSFIIPAITLPLDTAQPPAIMQPVMYINSIQAIEEPIRTIEPSPKLVIKTFDWATAIKAVYVAMATVSVLHLAFMLLVFYRRSKAETLMQIGNVRVLRGSSKQGNSSFLNVIFVSDNKLEPAEVTQIIAHEMLHVKLLHSADRIIARLVQIVLWFNPFTYCYIRSIEENHEFEVDRIIAGENDKSIYATLLFKLSITGNNSYLMHSFSKVPLKSRIAMLFNKPTSNMKKIIYALVLPVVAISCLAFANLDVKSPFIKHPYVKKAETTLADTNIGINKYRQIDRLRGKRNPYPDYSKSPGYIKKRKIALRIANNINTYKITGVTSIEANNSVKLPHGYIMTNEGDEFILTTLYGKRNELDGKLNIGDEIQVKGMAISLIKDSKVIIMAENVMRGNELIYKANPEDIKDTTAFLFEGNRVRYMHGKVTNIQKYANGKWKSAVVVKENGYRVKFMVKPTAPSFANIKEGDEVTFRFVHEFKKGAKEYTVNDWVALSNNIKDYGIKNPDYFYKFYEKI